MKGNTYQTKYGSLKVVKELSGSKLLVEFLQTGNVFEAHKHNVLKGRVKDKLFPSVFGVGFIGIGKHAATIKGKKTKAYLVWSLMIQRCYSESSLKKRPTYIGCSVCVEWHNFQNFAEWFEINYPKDGKDYQLDKDILIEGNKVYFPEACLFVDHYKNNEKAHAKSFLMIDPKGEEFSIYNMRKFCRYNSLHPARMLEVFYGKLKKHKGWTVK